MADASQTYRRGIAQPAGPRFEKYLGIVGTAAALLGVVAIFGSTETIWYYTRELFASLYLLALTVAS